MTTLAETIDERRAKFRSDLATFEVPVLVQRHITTGPTFLLNDDKYHQLRACVANHFALHPNEVLVVGSAKLGFSIVKKKRYRPFGDESDIDVAVVSSRLFDKFWASTYDFSRRSPYWPERQRFADYLFRGWIRPDLLPTSLAGASRWWEFFRKLTEEGTFGPYQIRGGLYKSWHYLDTYHAVCIEECKRSEQA